MFDSEGAGGRDKTLRTDNSDFNIFIILQE